MHLHQIGKILRHAPRRFLALSIVTGCLISSIAQSEQPQLTSLDFFTLLQPTPVGTNYLDHGTVQRVCRAGSSNYFAAGDFSGQISLGGLRATNQNSAVATFVARLGPAGVPFWLQASEGGLTFAEIISHPNGGAAVISYFKGPITNHFAGVTLVATSDWGAFIVQFSPAGTVEQTILLEAWGNDAKNFSTGDGVVPFTVVSAQYDTAGNLIVAGNYLNRIAIGRTQLIAGPGTNEINYFVAKLGVTGGVQWAKQGGSVSEDRLLASTVDSTGNTFLTGVFGGTNIFDGVTLMAPSMQEGDGFLLKLNPAGTLVWARQASVVISGYSRDFGRVVSDGSGGCYVMGIGSRSAPPGLQHEVFVARFDDSGDQAWLQRLSTPTNQPPVYEAIDATMRTDAAGNVYLAGQASTAFTVGALSFTNQALFPQSQSPAAFVLKLSASGVPQWVNAICTGNIQFLWDFQTDAAGNSFARGTFANTVQIGNTPLTSRSVSDDFLVKLDVKGEPVWAIQAGGQGTSWVNGLVPNESGGVFVHGLSTGLNYLINTPLTGAGSAFSFVAQIGDGQSSNAPSVLLDPSSQTLVGPASAWLSASVLGLQPLSFQWIKNGTNLNGATNAALSLPQLQRADSGSYSVVVSNTLGTISTTNALLRVLIPQRLYVSQTSPGSNGFRLRFGDYDGNFMSLNDLSNFEVHVSSDLGTTNWSRFTNGLSLTNGLVLFDDIAATNHAQRFYRVVER